MYVSCASNFSLKWPIAYDALHVARYSVGNSHHKSVYNNNNNNNKYKQTNNSNKTLNNDNKKYPDSFILTFLDKT